MTAWPTSPSFESGQIAQLSDRRRDFRRAPAVAGTHLWLDEYRRIPVQIVDESVDGIGIVVPNDCSFEIGPRVYVDYDFRRRSASVAHLARRSDGSYRLGLEWLTPIGERLDAVHNLAFSLTSVRMK